MKKWFVGGLVLGAMLVVGRSELACAEEVEVIDNAEIELTEASDEMVDFVEAVAPEDTSEAIVEYDSANEQEIESPLRSAIRSRSLSEDMLAEAYMPEDSSLEIAPRTILGRDDRYRVTNTTAFPNRAVGLIEVTFPNGRTTYGSAAMVGKNVALTAGHCLYNKSFGGWAKKVTYYPARNGSSLPYGSYRGRKFISSQTYINTGNIAYDWGVIRFDSNPGGKHGYFGFQTTEADQTGKRLYTRGYPGDKAFGTMYGCAGNLLGYNSNKLRMFYTMDTTGGQSGSPIYDSNNIIQAVHTHSGSTRNVGRRIDKTLYNVLNNGRKW